MENKTKWKQVFNQITIKTLNPSQYVEQDIYGSWTDTNFTADITKYTQNINDGLCQVKKKSW